MNSFKQSITYQWPDFLKDLQQMMQIASVKGTATAEAPYGEGPLNALKQALAFGTMYGFKTKMIDGKIGYIEWGQSSTDYIGIFGHVDVVAAGAGWSVSPFDLTEKAGRFYGRGILDNKGPIMSCLYGLKLLKDAGIEPKNTIRIIFGSDEESGMSDIPAYLAAEPAPVFGFTPDCKYPVVYGERGIVHVLLAFSLTEQDLHMLGTFEGEQSTAYVPDCVSTTLSGEKMTGYGKRAPSNAPELGKNAITQLAIQFQQQEALSAKGQAAFAWIVEMLHEQHTGAGFGLNQYTETTDQLLMTPVILQKTPTGLSLAISVRYPVNTKEEEVLTCMENALPSNASIHVTRRLPSICRDKHSLGVTLLSEVYAQMTGTYSPPVTTTGATYARKVPNIVAFGPSFPGQKGIAHREDEYMAVDDLKQNLAIYMQAMAALIEDETIIQAMK